MRLSVTTKNGFLDVVYELIWISVIIAALTCAIAFGLPRSAMADSNLIETPAYAPVESVPEEKEQYSVTNAKAPTLVIRKSDGGFEGGSKYEDSFELKVGETNDYVIQDDQISEINDEADTGSQLH